MVLAPVRRAYRPETPEGAADCSYAFPVRVDKATTEQGHRSQGPNDTARPRRRGDRIVVLMQERLLEGRTALVTGSIRALASPSARRLPRLVLVSCIEKTSIALRQDFDASQQDF